jgi:hypothetical protein
MFHTWKAYVRQRQEMRRKHIRAEDHGEKRKLVPKEVPRALSQKPWEGWHVAVKE